MSETTARTRLPNRRPSHTETLTVGGQVFTAAVGLDPETGRPRELFLSAGKEGSLLNAMLADAAVAISVALQHDVPAEALAPSVGRLPAGMVTPADLDQPQAEKLPASRSERRLDELIRAQKETVGLATAGQRGGRRKIDGSREEPTNKPPTLAEAGIYKKL